MAGVTPADSRDVADNLGAGGVLAQAELTGSDDLTSDASLGDREPGDSTDDDVVMKAGPYQMHIRIIRVRSVLPARRVVACGLLH